MCDPFHNYSICFSFLKGDLSFIRQGVTISKKGFLAPNFIHFSLSIIKWGISLLGVGLVGL